MPRIAVVVGTLLVVVGVVAYGVSLPGASPTALIPAGIGLVVAIAGVLGGRSEANRRHAMHAATLVALLGLLGSAGQLVARPAAGSDGEGVAAVAGVATLLLCAVFVVLAVRSFIAVRRSRTSGAAGTA